MIKCLLVFYVFKQHLKFLPIKTKAAKYCIQILYYKEIKIALHGEDEGFQAAVLGLETKSLRSRFRT